MHLTIQGLVLRVTQYQDHDALLTILTRDHGKLTVKARGLRRKNSPLVAPCQLLALSEFTLFEYRGNYTVNDAATIELFHSLRKDLSLLSLGTYMAHVAEAICVEDVPNPELLSLVLNCLYALSNLNLSESVVKAVFELRSACIAGYAPDLSGCYGCGATDPDLLDLSGGHLECSKCRNYDSKGIRMPVSSGALEAMRYICLCEAKKIFSFTIPSHTASELSQITESYLVTQLERGFATLDFYKSLQIENTLIGDSYV